jgi:hypothetical protein
MHALLYVYSIPLQCHVILSKDLNLKLREITNISMYQKILEKLVNTFESNSSPHFAKKYV